MKKPKYTRCTYYYPPKTHIADNATIREFEKIIERQTVARQWFIETLIKNKSKLSKGSLKYVLRLKRSINKNLRGTKRILKSILRKNRNKPPDVFQRYHPFTQPEAIEAVRTSPEAIAYIKETFADIDSGPFNGMFTWDAGITPGDRFKDSKPRLYVMVKCFDPNHGFKINNKIHAYKREWVRLAKRSFEFFELDKPNASNAVV